jgi:hypothetical protein
MRAKAPKRLTARRRSTLRSIRVRTTPASTGSSGSAPVRRLPPVRSREVSAWRAPPSRSRTKALSLRGRASLDESAAAEADWKAGRRTSGPTGRRAGVGARAGRFATGSQSSNSVPQPDHHESAGNGAFAFGIGEASGAAPVASNASGISITSSGSSSHSSASNDTRRGRCKPLRTKPQGDPTHGEIRWPPAGTSGGRQ